MIAGLRWLREDTAGMCRAEAKIGRHPVSLSHLAHLCHQSEFALIYHIMRKASYIYKGTRGYVPSHQFYLDYAHAFVVDFYRQSHFPVDIVRYIPYWRKLAGISQLYHV